MKLITEATDKDQTLTEAAIDALMEKEITAEEIIFTLAQTLTESIGEMVAADDDDHAPLKEAIDLLYRAEIVLRTNCTEGELIMEAAKQRGVTK